MHHPKPTLILTEGLPGSGKSTYARQLLSVEKPGTLIRANRDLIREMIHGEHALTPQTEAQVTAIQNHITTTTLHDGTDVIVDDTNLNPVHRERLETLAWTCGAHVVRESFKHVPLSVCLERNARRHTHNRVPEDYIRSVYRQFVQQLLPGRMAMQVSHFGFKEALVDARKKPGFIWLQDGLTDAPIYRQSIEWLNDNPAELVSNALRVIGDRLRYASERTSPGQIENPFSPITVLVSRDWFVSLSRSERDSLATETVSRDCLARLVSGETVSGVSLVLIPSETTERDNSARLKRDTETTERDNSETPSVSHRDTVSR
jgi:predicted kinase